jgi:hypothetical protein
LSSFVGALEVDLIRKERKDEEAPSIIDLIEEFEEHYHMQQVASSATTANSSAFVTLGNSNTNLDDGNTNSNSNSNSNLRRRRPYICGLMY